MPSMRKHQPSLVTAINIPASDGPTRRAMFTIDELMAMAFDRSRAVLDHLHHERLPPRHVERVDDALHHAETKNPLNRDVVGERKRGQCQRLNHGQRLRPHQHLPAVEPVNPHAGEGRKDEMSESARRS